MMRRATLIIILIVPVIVTVLAMAEDCPVQPPEGCEFYMNDCPMWVDVDSMYIYPTGSSTDRWDIAITGDGYTGDYFTTDFFEDSAEAIETILSMPPFSDYPCAFNFYEAYVPSNQTGADSQYVDTATGDTLEVCRDTQLNMSFGHLRDKDDPSDDFPEYVLVTPTQARCFQAAKVSGVSNFDLVIVLVNDKKFGGSAWLEGEAPILYVSVGYKFNATITHELAHLVAPLEDEYNCGLCACDGTPEAGATLVDWPVGEDEPPQPNVTTDLESDKWDVNAPVPTEPDGDYGVPIEDVIGRFEGAAGYETGVYRPQVMCQMRCLLDDDGEIVQFCTVCTEELRKELSCISVPGKPTAVSCDLMVKRYQFFWIDETLLRFPIPRSGYAFDAAADTVRIDVRSSSPHGQLMVVDQSGAAVSRSAVPGSALRVTFLPDPFEEYWLELDTGPPTREVLTMDVEMNVNGRQVDLPD